MAGAIAMAEAGVTASSLPIPAEQQLINWLFNDTIYGQSNIQGEYYVLK
jgi:hypothetical protein